MAEATVGLADAIAALRRELGEALRAGAGEDIQFRLGEASLEVQLEVKREVGGGGGLKFWVVSAEGKAQESRGAQHRLKLVLHPVHASDGTDLQIASASSTRPE